MPECPRFGAIWVYLAASPLFARFLFDRIGIASHQVCGFALGVASHGIGTARAFQVSSEMGGFAGLGVGLNGVLIALLAPRLVPVVCAFLHRYCSTPQHTSAVPNPFAFCYSDKIR